MTTELPMRVLNVYQVGHQSTENGIPTYRSALPTYRMPAAHYHLVTKALIRCRPVALLSWRQHFPRNCGVAQQVPEGALRSSRATRVVNRATFFAPGEKNIARALFAGG